MRRFRSRGPVGLGAIAAWSLGLALAVSASAQEAARPRGRAAAPRGEAAAPRGEAEGFGDITTRYHFFEDYSAKEGQPEPGKIGQYRVGVLETIKTAVDRPQGAPERTEATVQMVYSEKAAEVSVAGIVTAVVRRYLTFRLPNDPASRRPPDRPLMEGMLVWFQHRPGEEAMVLSLMGRRELRETEVMFASRQAFLPDLGSILPSASARIGDRWPVRGGALRSLLGDRPGRADLTATLSQVRKGKTTPEAIIDVTGQATLPKGETTVNARLVFTFAEAPGPTRAAGPSPAR